MIDTIPWRLTKGTASEIERIRGVIAKEMGIDVLNIKKKHAEIVLRLKSQKGKVMKSEINDVLIGKIK